MTHLTFDEWACRNARARLDSYIDDELLVETNLELAHHFERCGECAQEAAARRALRDRLKAAARSERAPDGFEDRVRARLRHSGRARSAPWSMMAIAAAIVLCLGAWGVYDRSLAPIPARLAAVLGIGVGNHLHCAVIRQAVTKPSGQDKLTPEWKPLLAVARDRVPGDLRLAVAHQCAFEGRSFVHLTFRNDRRLLSVIVTRKGQGETLAVPGVRAAASHGGIDFYAGKVGEFQAAAFESGEFLAYAVSDLSKQENLRILEAIAPAVKAHQALSARAFFSTQPLFPVCNPAVRADWAD